MRLCHFPQSVKIWIMYYCNPHGLQSYWGCISTGLHELPPHFRSWQTQGLEDQRPGTCWHVLWEHLQCLIGPQRQIPHLHTCLWTHATLSLSLTHTHTHLSDRVSLRALWGHVWGDENKGASIKCMRQGWERAWMKDLSVACKVPQTTC